MSKKKLDIIDLLNLTDDRLEIEIDIVDNMRGYKPDKDSLEYLILNGGRGFKEIEEEKLRSKEFLYLFEKNFDKICEIAERDPKRRIPVSCYTCIRGMNLRDQYGAPKKH